MHTILFNKTNTNQIQNMMEDLNKDDMEFLIRLLFKEETNVYNMKVNGLLSANTVNMRMSKISSISIKLMTKKDMDFPCP